MSERTFDANTSPVDRGGTFCDCIGVVPGREDIVVKLLSVDPNNYDDAPTEGIRRILESATGKPCPRGQLIDASKIGEQRIFLLAAVDAC